jgi:hypothetical protein
VLQLWSDVPANLDCGDVLRTEIGELCDWQNHVMNLGCRYKDMPTFRLAVRQFTIKKEFELRIESTNSYWYRGFCQVGDCPWKILQGYKQRMQQQSL